MDNRINQLERKAKILEDHADAYGQISLNAHQLKNDLSYLINTIKRLEKSLDRIE